MTAQNTKGVTAVSASSKDFMRAQLEAVAREVARRVEAGLGG